MATRDKIGQNVRPSQTTEIAVDPNVPHGGNPSVKPRLIPIIILRYTPFSLVVPYHVRGVTQARLLRSQDTNLTTYEAAIA